MKKIIYFIMLILILISSIVFNGCNNQMPRPQYESQYTEEEQIYRITCEARNRYEEMLENGDMISISVYILYTFDNFPEYFLIEHTWKNYDAYLNYLKYVGYDKEMDMGIENDTIYNTHIIGFMENDRYYLGVFNYPCEMQGLSYYTTTGAINKKAKLYHANNTYAYRYNDIIYGCDYNILKNNGTEIKLDNERIISNEDALKLGVKDRVSFRLEREKRVLIRKRRSELYN